MSDRITVLKQQLALELRPVLARHHQSNAAALLQTDQPRVSNILRGRLKRFSLERLIVFAERMGGTVELTVQWRRHGTRSGDMRGATPGTRSGDMRNAAMKPA